MSIPGRRARRLTALVVPVAIVLVTSGCGTAGGGGSETSAEATTWVADLCGGLAGVAGTVAAQEAVDTGDTPRLAAVYPEQMREIRTAVEGVLTSLDQLGAPPVDDGDVALADLRESFTATRDAVRGAEDTASAANPSGAIGFQQVQRAVETGYTAGRAMTDEVAGHPALADAFAGSPACQDADAAADGRPGSA